MRFMVIVKASKNSEAGMMPSEKLLAEMGKFKEELTKAGVMLAADGLQASSKGARVKFSANKRTVIDGPFAETKELVAGFWIWQCKSLKETIDWVKRCPNPMPGEEAESRFGKCSKRRTSPRSLRPSIVTRQNAFINKAVASSEKENEAMAAKVSATLNAPVTKLWEHLTKPELIKKYFFSTEVETDWKPGSLIYFRGAWQGKQYEDKGKILEVIPHQSLSYLYWSSFSGLPDHPENYQ